MLQQTRIAFDSGEPVVTEGETRQVQARLGRVDHARQAREGQVAAQHAVRSTSRESGNKLAGADHPLTLAHRDGAPNGQVATAQLSDGRENVQANGVNQVMPS